jgi:hypothetical protein
MPYLVLAEAGRCESCGIEGLYETEAEATRFAQHLRRVQRLRMAAGDNGSSVDDLSYGIKYVPLCATAPDAAALEQVEAAYADRAAAHQERQRRAASERLQAQRRTKDAELDAMRARLRECS